MASSHFWDLKEPTVGCGELKCPSPSKCYWPRGLSEPHICLPPHVDPNNIQPAVVLPPDLALIFGLLAILLIFLLGLLVGKLSGHLVCSCRKRGRSGPLEAVEAIPLRQKYVRRRQPEPRLSTTGSVQPPAPPVSQAPSVSRAASFHAVNLGDNVPEEAANPYDHWG